MESIEEKLTFSPDSPLFAKRVTQYGNDLEKLGDFLKLMVRQMKQFCRDIENSSKTANEMGNAMRLGLGSSSEAHSSLIPVIRQFGDIYTEIAAAQMILCESLDKTFVQPVEAFVTNEIVKVQAMKQHYNNQHELFDLYLQKYLQGEASNFGNRAASTSQWDQKALDVVQQKRRVEITRFDLVKKINEIEAKKSFEVAECCVSAIYAIRTHHHQCAEIINSSALDELSRRQQTERRAYENMISQQRRQGGDEKKLEMISSLDKIINRIKSLSTLQTELMINNYESPSNINQDSRSVINNQNRALDDQNLISVPSSSSQFSSSSNIHIRSSQSGGSGGVNSFSHSQSLASTEAMNNKSRFSRISAIGASIMSGLKKSADSNTKIDSNSLQSSTSVNQRGSNSNNNHAAMHSDTNASKTNRTITSSSISVDSESSSSLLISCEEREKKLRALDFSEMVGIYTVNPIEEPEGVVYQGYLWKRSTSHKVRQHWNRRWFVLDTTKMYYIKEDVEGGGNQIHLVCDLMLGSARESKTADMPFCFEIVYANVRTTTLQAEGGRQMQDWMDAIRNAIGRRLVVGGLTLRQGNSVSDSSKRSGSAPKYISAGTAMDPDQRKKLTELAESLLAANPHCADCGRAGPDWVSLNLGCLVCIDCSGVHRSLGVHISKMRSLTLDDLELEEYALIQKLGNDVSNSIWDTTNQAVQNTDGSVVVKPKPTDPEQIRYSYIQAKYKYRQLLSDALPRLEDSSPSEEDGRALEDGLIEAIRSDDVVQAMNILAHGGGSLLQIITERKEKWAIPLHTAAACGSIACCTLLLLNGIDVMSRDEEGRLAIEVAEECGHSEVATYLRRKMESIQSNNSSHRNQPNDTSSKKHISVTEEILTCNSTCADCSKSNPEWVAINLGCLICFECSGVHRSLGVHVSRVRSLLADYLDLEEYELMKRVGNNISNAIWECNNFADKDGLKFTKPTANSPENIRIAYIKAKYKQKLFLSPSLPKIDEDMLADQTTIECLKMILVAAVEADDVPGALKAIAHGASYDIYLRYPSPKAPSPLHVAAASGSVACCTLLVLNGFDIASRDEEGRLPFDIAVENGHTAIVAYLNGKSTTLPSSSSVSVSKMKASSDSFDSDDIISSKSDNVSDM